MSDVGVPVPDKLCLPTPSSILQEMPRDWRGFLLFGLTQAQAYIYNRVSSSK